MMKVLLVEDDYYIRVSIKEMLETEAFSVTTATNGMEALEAIGSVLEPDLIILDLMMPTLSGWEFLRELRALQRGAHIPVIVCSAWDDMPQNVEIQGYLHKPFEVDDFLTLVEKVGGAQRTREFTAGTAPVVRH